MPLLKRCLGTPPERLVARRINHGRLQGGASAVGARVSLSARLRGGRGSLSPEGAWLFPRVPGQAYDSRPLLTASPTLARHLLEKHRSQGHVAAFTLERALSLGAGRSESLIQRESRRRRMQFDSKGRLWRMLAILALGGGCTAAVSDEVTDRAKDPNLWAAPGGDQAQTRHSQLEDIPAANGKGLQMVWSQSSGTLRGHEGQPLVVTVGSTPMMYMESGWPNIIQALDLTAPDHPKEIWNYMKTVQ